MDQVLHVTFGEENNDEDHLNVHLDDGLTNEGRAEKGGERNEEVTTGDARQVEQRVRNLQK